MNKDLAIRTGKVGGAVAHRRRWVGYVQHAGTISEEAFNECVAEMANRAPEDVGYALAMVKKSLVKLLRQGFLVKTGGVTYRPVCRGPFSSPDAAFDPSVNKLEVVAIPNQNLKGCMKGLVPDNLVKGPHPIVQSILDSVTGKERILDPGHTIYVAGRNLETDPTHHDEKAWFENRDGAVVATGKIVKSTATTMDVIFETWPEPGVYTLCLSTRSGLSEDYSLAVIRKEVTVGSR